MFYARLLFCVVLLVAVSKVSNAQGNGGFDHRAHSVPGQDKVVYDINDDGSEEVEVDGSGSHSHYFDAGPPIKSGEIVQFEWTNAADGTVVCQEKTCRLLFLVGQTMLQLKVTDNTGDSATDTVTITVLPRSAAISPPRIDALNPGKGPANGKNTVTIKGDSLYADSQVYFGNNMANNIKQIDLNTIVCEAPAGFGNVGVKVVSQLGESNTQSYEYQQGGSVPIDFKLDSWKKPDGNNFIAEEITSITIGHDHRYYMGSLTGYVTSVLVNRELIVEDSCKGAYVGDQRVITGIAYNPLDPYPRVFVSTNTHYHAKAGARWDNAKIEAIDIQPNGCPSVGSTIISGLPTSNHDHGTSAITFLQDGRMLITVGSFTNAGVSTPGDGIGGVPENPLSAAAVHADYLRPGFNGNIVYDQYDNPETANIVSGDVGIYCTGLRNSFGIVVHSNEQIYATDNGPNLNFGLKSTSCTESEDDPESEDKLLRLLPGQYYGHPNRNRGRFDPRQCKYRSPFEGPGDGYQAPLGMMESSTNGIIEYRANVFQGELKGNLFMSKVSFGEKGLLWRAELSDNGEWLQAGPYQFRDRSGVSLVQGLYGELVMPQLKKYFVLVYQPFEVAPPSVELINVYPSRGPKAGGNVIMITGHQLNMPDIVVTVGGNPCTNFYYIDYQHLKCTVPPGEGKVKVTVTSGEFESTSYGHEYEYW